MTIRNLVIFSVTLLTIFCIRIGSAFPQNDIQEEMVNPHWTGKDCIECHVEEYPRGKNAPLKFGGDSVKLCNRCHETEFARTDIHPVGVDLHGGIDGADEEGLHLHALPAGRSRLRGNGRGDRRRPLAHLPGGGEPPAHRQGAHGTDDVAGANRCRPGRNANG